MRIKIVRNSYTFPFTSKAAIVAVNWETVLTDCKEGIFLIVI